MAMQRRLKNFRSCTGAKGAADHIENAPNPSDGKDVIKALNKAIAAEQVIYSGFAVLLGAVLFRKRNKKFLWIYILAAVIFSGAVKNKFQDIYYKKLIIR